MAIEQTQAFVAWPAAVFAEHLQLHGRVGAQKNFGVIAVELVDEALQLLIKLEALDTVGQQRRDLFLLDMHFAQRVFAGSADLQDGFALARGQALDRRADTAQRGCAIPFQRLLQFSVPGTFAIVAQHRLVCVGATRMFDAVLPRHLTFPDCKMRVLQGQ